MWISQLRQLALERVRLDETLRRVLLTLLQVVDATTRRCVIASEKVATSSSSWFSEREAGVW